MRNRSVIIATFTVDGFHYWPDAPPKFGHLSHRHYHRFQFRVEIGVVDFDRELEFQQVAADCRTRILDGRAEPIDFAANSCESIAHQLLAYIQGRWPSTFYAVEVWEDGVHGARLQIEE